MMFIEERKEKQNRNNNKKEAKQNNEKSINKLIQEIVLRLTTILFFFNPYKFEQVNVQLYKLLPIFLIRNSYYQLQPIMYVYHPLKR